MDNKEYALQYSQFSQNYDFINEYEKLKEIKELENIL